MNTMSVSRRKFAQLLGAGAAAALVRPPVSFAKPTQPDATSSTTSGSVVRLSANENPYGPSPNALKAITNSFGLSCRYPDEHNNMLIDKLAKLNGVNHDEILLGDGSGEILKLCAETFTGPQNGKLVAADPTFEAILNNAKANGAEVVKVPLNSTFAHDLPKMHAATKSGLIYICNPNNPTASITPKDELRDFIAKTPRETMILVDEAYFHYADSPDYESVIPLVKERPNLVVSRTFSKIYGMAGLRCGYCVAQKENRRDLGAPKDGPQDNSIAGQLHYVRLQETGRSADKDVEGAERPCRPVIPGTAKSYASHHRQKIRNGNLLGNLSRIDDITFVFRRCSGGCVNRRIKIINKASPFRAPFQLRVSAEQAVHQEVNRSSKQANDGHH